MTIALENLAPVFPGPEALSYTPRMLRTMAKRIDSPAIGVCLDVGHAHLVASLRRTDIAELIEPVLDRVAVFHLHDNLGARRGARPARSSTRCGSTFTCRSAGEASPGIASPRCSGERRLRRSCSRSILRGPRRHD